jgi:TRAP-type C4-dicarboxylate transport system permease large subunit
MAGVSGAAVADASATGTILIPAMKEEGYEPEFAGA